MYVAYYFIWHYIYTFTYDITYYINISYLSSHINICSFNEIMLFGAIMFQQIGIDSASNGRSFFKMLQEESMRFPKPYIVIFIALSCFSEFNVSYYYQSHHTF